MGSFEDLTQTVTCRYHDRIKRTCAPLYDYLNISDFWHYSITNSGSMTYFASHAEWNEYFATEKFYLSFPLLRDPKIFQDSVSFMRALNYKPFSQILTAAKNKFNIHPGLAWMNKTSEGIEGFGFCSNTPDELQSALLLRKLPLLRLFVKKFREENQFLFLKMEDNQINLAELMGLTFYENPMIFELSERRKFLKALGIEVESPLSKREVDVIRLLKEGFSAREIGEQLFLSKRTIEHHVERMKEKLGCESRAELIQKARELEGFGYF